MKYQEALKEKNVKKEDLSKKLQLKIDKLVEKSKTATDEEVATMDEEIAKEVKKFNLEVHKRRLESIAKLNKKSAPAKVDVEVESEPELKDSLEIKQSVPAINTDKLKGNLAELRQIALEAEELRSYQERLKEYQQSQQFEEPEPEEIQDFQKAKRSIPKGKSLSFGLIGIGIFFLTWGAVNLARQK